VTFAQRWMAGGAYSVIVANAPQPVLADDVRLLHRADDLIAADGGARELLRRGLRPTLVIGDADSLTPAELTQLELAAVALERHPPAKDETDLELALLAAQRRGARRLVVYGALGGRWDQSLANIALLALPELAACRTVLRDGAQTIELVRERLELTAPIGTTVSLLPFGGAAAGVTTAGLAYPLTDARLHLERSRGVSNVVIAAPAAVQLRSGLLLVVTDDA
jgi:thiamine pyrophosphokinase